ncbi:hypothetical protein EVAR_49669_1 [Eumeta japonica]|uniref:Uncharacterized protein n=1 Tax=Eumeta variegata TaxID=151549 RepID=A0A4C1WSE1_EUMVA|nr:hypothetical protein EVAR_49669_1 [Eumeta japonica]
MIKGKKYEWVTGTLNRKTKSISGKSHLYSDSVAFHRSSWPIFVLQPRRMCNRYNEYRDRERNQDHNRKQAQARNLYRVVGTPACRLTAFSEAVIEVQLYSICRPAIPSSGGLI